LTSDGIQGIGIMSIRSPIIVVKRRRPPAPRLARSLSETSNFRPPDGSPSNTQNLRTRRVLHLSAVPSNDVTARLPWLNARAQASDEA
jgi:hypothetical protein